MEKYTNSRAAGQVKRYHVCPTLQSQSVGEHTFHALRIYIELFGPPAPDTTIAIVSHDLGEIGAGDMPFPAKRDNPALAEMMDRIEKKTRFEIGWGYTEISDEQERTKIKICDLMEMTEFGYIELNLGNKFAELIVLNAGNAVRRLARGLETDLEDKVLEYLAVMQERYSG